MKKRIVIHATNRPADMSVTRNDIEDMSSQDMKSYPMPYHYIVNIDDRTMKGKRDKELCGYCGKFSGDSISVAYAGRIPFGAQVLQAKLLTRNVIEPQKPQLTHNESCSLSLPHIYKPFPTHQKPTYHSFILTQCFLQKTFSYLLCISEKTLTFAHRKTINPILCKHSTHIHISTGQVPPSISSSA